MFKNLKILEPPGARRFEVKISNETKNAAAKNLSLVGFSSLSAYMQHCFGLLASGDAATIPEFHATTCISSSPDVVGPFENLVLRTRRVQLRSNRNRRPKFYKQFKKDFCAHCGFIPQSLCQLDVHHIDGDHTNDSPFNLETICANCHRLEHSIEGREILARKKTA